jgi:transposase
VAFCTVSEAGIKRSRRTWSAEVKRRIVAEALRPGASVAEVARRHGLNANLVFAWRRMLQPATVTADDTSPCLLACSEAPPPAVDPPEFVPIGVFARADDDGSGLRAQGPPVALAATASGRPGVARPAMDERPGVIEIDLVDGIRLRVDAFVNERALRRVLAALRTSS